MRAARAVVAACALWGAALLGNGPASAGVEPVLVVSGLSAPLRVTAPAGDFSRLFVVEQEGESGS